MAEHEEVDPLNNEVVTYTEDVLPPARATEQGCFSVTIHMALREEFNRWLVEHDQAVASMGEDEAGTPVYVSIIRRGSATEQRLIQRGQGR